MYIFIYYSYICYIQYMLYCREGEVVRIRDICNMVLMAHCKTCVVGISYHNIVYSTVQYSAVNYNAAHDNLL